MPSPVYLITFLALLVLNGQAETPSPCVYTATDGSVYNLNSLIASDDFVVGHSGSPELFYFAICRDTYTCTGAACSQIGPQQSIIRGSLDAMDWSDQYTRVGKGITIVYEDGQSTCATSTPSRFLVTLVCDESTDALLMSFDSDCFQNHVTMKSRYACPRAEMQEEEPENESVFAFDYDDDSEMPTWLPWAIVGSMVGFSLLVTIVVLSLGVMSDCQMKDELLAAKLLLSPYNTRDNYL